MVFVHVARDPFYKFYLFIFEIFDLHIESFGLNIFAILCYMMSELILIQYFIYFM